MKSEIMVSVCCITYNHENYIKKTLEGILNQQTNFAFELLIHDDASTDNTQKIIKEFTKSHPSIIKPIFQKKNIKSSIKSGMNPTFNYPRARGKYIAICDGDDHWIDNTKLQKQVDCLERDSSLSGCYHGVKIKYIKSGRVKTIRNKGLTTYDLGSYLEKNPFIATSSMVFRTEITNLIPGWSKNIFAGDFLMRYLIAVNGKIRYLDFIMSTYNKGVEGSWTMTKNEQKRIDKEFSDNIYALLKINEYSNYQYQFEVLKKVDFIITRYKRRSALVTNWQKRLKIIWSNPGVINFKLLKGLIRTSILRESH